MTLTVVKVGGSFARSAYLPVIISALEQGRGRTVVVPGGGPFADCVRREQGRIRFDDRAAHRMALLSMAEFGYALASLSKELVPVASVAAMRNAPAKASVPIWLPLDLLDGRTDIPETWDTTSDSLAAWLTGQLVAQRLIFVKRASPRSMAMADLLHDGILDTILPRFLEGSLTEAWLCGPRDITRLGAALAAGRPAGRRIEVA